MECQVESKRKRERADDKVGDHEREGNGRRKEGEEKRREKYNEEREEKKRRRRKVANRLPATNLK